MCANIYDEFRVNMIRLGFHVSIAGSVANAPTEAIQEGYDAFQIFTTSSRSWTNSRISDKDANEFTRLVKSSNLEAFAHMPYLCNPASTNKDVHDKSRKMLIDNMNNCRVLGIRYLVMHTGSHLGVGTSVGIENVCSLLGSAIGEIDGVDVLLENGSGYNNSVGSKFGEIGQIIEKVGTQRIGVCFDTCHAFAAGYDISTDKSVESMVEEFDSSIGLSRLRFVHLNDAKHPLGSGLDRHWHIGKGYIGRKGFVSLFRNKAFRNGSFVMELPEDEEAGHTQDMNAALSIIRESGIR